MRERPKRTIDSTICQADGHRLDAPLLFQNTIDRQYFHFDDDWAMFSLSEVRRHWSESVAPATEDCAHKLCARKGRVMASKAGRDGDRSHSGVRRIKHWIKLDDETARLLREIVAIEQAWGRQTDDQGVLASMIRVGHQMWMIEAHISARPPRPRR